MSLNPIVALSEQFQKLINEHGSAAILRDHLALFKDQVLVLEKENLRLINESGVYKISEEKLKSDIQHLQKENDELRCKIQEYEQPAEQPMHNNLLDEFKMNILKLLFITDELMIEAIAQAVTKDIQTTKYHLEELKTANMVKSIQHRISPRSNNFGYFWNIEQTGRAYLIENKIV